MGVRSGAELIQLDLTTQRNAPGVALTTRGLAPNDWSVQMHPHSTHTPSTPSTESHPQISFEALVWRHPALEGIFAEAESTRDWTVFGLVSGDETFTNGLVTYRAWSAYRQAISPTWAVGSDLASPRLITDAQFAGQ